MIIYKTIHGEGEGFHVEKKSKFIASVKECIQEEDAVSFISEIKKKYPDARHHTYAYIIGKNKEIQKYSDDGEPQGTAGIPILEYIKKEELTNICIVVTRYFGGILLGKGGLIRAYGKAAKLVETLVEKVDVRSFWEIKLTADYSYLGSIENTTANKKWNLKNKDYLDKVFFDYLIEEEQIEDFNETIMNLTNGNGEIQQGDLLLKKEKNKIVLD